MAAVTGVSYDDLAVLLAILRHSTLNAAARSLRIGPSTASRRLTRLEERMGTALFDRTPEGMMPTQMALDLRPHAELVEARMADIERLIAQHHSGPRGRLRLAMPDGLASAWVGPQLGSFFTAHPEVEVDLVVGHAVVDLVRREADLAVRFVRPTAPDLVCQRLGEIPMAAFVHPDAPRLPLREHRWITFDDPDARYMETRWIRDHIAPHRTMACSNWQSLFTAVCAGIGPGLLSPLVAEPAGLVRVAADRTPVPPRELVLVYHRAMRNVPKVAAMRRWLADSAGAFLLAPAGDALDVH